MRPKLELRQRIAITFAAFGAAIGTVMAVALFLATHDLGERIIDETLQAELDDLFARRQRNPNSLPPRTITLHGYLRHKTAPTPDDLPHELAHLSPGRHNLTIGSLSYRAIVADRLDLRYILLYDTTWQQKREQRLLLFIGSSILVIILLSAAGGFWLVGLTIAPVTELADRVKSLSTNPWSLHLSTDFAHDEVGELARAFDLHLARIQAFTERERAFTADLSHELRTSLTVILGATELLLEENALSTKHKNRLLRIERAARDMAETGAALLLMAREERIWPPDEQTQVAQIIQDAVEKHRFILKNKPIEIVCQTDPTLRLNVDRQLLFVAIANLIRNAFAYTDQGHIHIQQNATSLTIQDTGPGLHTRLTDAVLPRHLAHPEGFGIGLTLVKRICDHQGWHLQLDGTETHNGGTRATIHFFCSPPARKT
ncbi:MAG: HAMP domain-containing histidine kinase [Magnetococcales bacterium]|nr:HAMP domain-containing histidine kinase [Magnetococcales bacterium]